MLSLSLLFDPVGVMCSLLAFSVEVELPKRSRCVKLAATAGRLRFDDAISVIVFDRVAKRRVTFDGTMLFRLIGGSAAGLVVVLGLLATLRVVICGATAADDFNGNFFAAFAVFDTPVAIIDRVIADDNGMLVLLVLLVNGVRDATDGFMFIGFTVDTGRMGPVRFSTFEYFIGPATSFFSSVGVDAFVLSVGFLTATTTFTSSTVFAASPGAAFAVGSHNFTVGCTTALFSPCDDCFSKNAFSISISLLIVWSTAL